MPHACASVRRETGSGPRVGNTRPGELDVRMFPVVIFKNGDEDQNVGCSECARTRGGRNGPGEA